MAVRASGARTDRPGSAMPGDPAQRTSASPNTGSGKPDRRDEEKLLYTLARVEELLGLEESKLYELMCCGKSTRSRSTEFAAIPRGGARSLLEQYRTEPGPRS